MLAQEVHKESLPVEHSNMASITPPEPNAWVLVEGRFKQLLLYNFKYLDGPDPEDKNCTTAESMV